MQPDLSFIFANFHPLMSSDGCVIMDITNLGVFFFRVVLHAMLKVTLPVFNG